MQNIKLSKLDLIKIISWSIILFSISAIIYHVRWLVPYLQDSIYHKVPSGQSPLVWFLAQIGSNIIFLYVGFALLRLNFNFHNRNMHTKNGLRIFDQVIVSCLGLVLLSVIRIASSDFYTLSLDQYVGIEGIFNLVTMLIIDTLTFKESQSMYIIIVPVMWIIKQFALKAISYKQENEAFI